MADELNEPLLTYPGYRVAEALINDINAEHVGYDLSRDLGLNEGTLYPLISRWVRAGWLTVRDEQPEEHATRPGRKGRPRKLIRVTDLGREKIPAYYYRWLAKNE